MSARQLEGIARFAVPLPGTSIAIGNFDGVHRGHQAVLAQVIEQASAQGLVPVVLTFEPHPAEVLGRGRVPKLTTLDRRIELLLRLDPRLKVVVEHFDVAFAAQIPETFATRLAKDLGARSVTVGRDFRFGRDRQGDFARLKELGEELGFDTVAERVSGDAAGAFSSTRARVSISEGRVDAAQIVLGRPHSLSGRVTKGAQRGRTLGFPTANFAEVHEHLPLLGVYACAVDVEGAQGFERLALGALNVGVRPTVADGSASPSVEVHLLEFSGDLYGRRLRAHLLTRVRDEARFSDLGSLKHQIDLDVRRVAEELAHLDRSAPGAWF